jgi:hypothetical protein
MERPKRVRGWPFPFRVANLIERVIIRSSHLLLEDGRRRVAQRAVWTDRMVVGAPVADDALSVGQILKPVLVQTSVLEASVDALNQRVRGRLGRAR